MANVIIKTLADGYELIGLNQHLDRRFKLYLSRKFNALYKGDVVFLPGNNGNIDLSGLVETLKGKNLDLELDENVDELIKEKFLEEQRFSEFSKEAKKIWNNEFDYDVFEEFCEVLAKRISRKFYPLQLLSSYHLAFSQNACNFSVPGAGKTSIVYGAFAYLNSRRDSKHVNKILVVGPLSSFGPWENEYEECFGQCPNVKRISGGALRPDEKKRYFHSETPADITLISYQGFISQRKNIEFFLRNNDVMVILDEAHKIKNTDGGKIADAILDVAEFAKSRVVLTGTPSPNGYRDLYNLFKFIWPNKNIISFSLNQLDDMTDNANDERIPILIDDISSFFVRIKKSDLNLPPKNENDSLKIQMDPIQKKIYKIISVNAINKMSDPELDNENFTDEIKKAKIIRMIQAASNPYLLLKPLKEFYCNEDNLVLGDELANLLKIYNERKIIPNKFRAALELTQEIIAKNGKVIVWGLFIDSIDMLSKYFQENGVNNKILYGKTRIESDGLDEEIETRESIIRQFHEVDSDFKVIIANPFAVAESISLHKACNNAIYFERNFDAARYLQSKDRIHRYGLEKDKLTNYYYLSSDGTIDDVIEERLHLKEELILRVSESSEIPLFSSLDDDISNEDIRAVLNHYSNEFE